MRSSPSPVRLLFGAAILVIIVTLIASRVTPGGGNTQSTIQLSDTSDTASTTSPAFTSAKFAGGDALTALGPNWSFLSQDELVGRTASMIPGTSATRATLTKLLGSNLELSILEMDIVSEAKLQKFLNGKDVKATTINEKAGHIVPVVGRPGGSGFLLNTSSTALFLQVGDVTGGLQPWPENVDPEIGTYIWSAYIR